MKLRKLTINHWRGIEHRQLEFQDGVTLLEGPNEVGKSTIIEAIQILFTELDSSNKKQVKSIQPVGQDVGSEVSAEFSVGDYDIIYSKIYNKNKSTTVQISGASIEHETGRTAHERVANILADQVDMALWNALLVDQGDQVGQTLLTQSVSLAQALDNAAGVSEADDLDDTSLIEAAQAEYERYFTLKTGRTKYSQLSERVDQTREDFTQLQTALKQLEQDSNNQEIAQEEVKRLQTLLPAMQIAEQEYKQTWQDLQAQTHVLTTKSQSLIEAQQQLADVTLGWQSRQALFKQITNQKHELQQLAAQMEPLQTTAAQESKAVERLRVTQTLFLNEESNLRNLEMLARGDLTYVEQLEQLDQCKQKLKQALSIEKKINEHLAVIARIAIDADLLERYRQAEQAVAVTEAKAQTASTTLTLKAKQAVTLSVDDSPVVLTKNQQYETSVTNYLSVDLPEWLAIEVSPPESTTDLERAHQQALQARSNLQQQSGVKDLKDATSQANQRASSETQLQQLQKQKLALLHRDQLNELEQQITVLTNTCNQYVQNRTADTPLPNSMAAASEALSRSTNMLQIHQREQAVTNQNLQTQADQLATAKQALEDKTQKHQAISAAIEALSERLTAERLNRSDADYEELERVQRGLVQQLAEEIDILKGDLSEETRTTHKILLDNASESLQRSAMDLRQQEQKLAILNDRLETARANGLHESLMATESRLAALQQELQATEQRAQAAKRLWETLNHHRDEARQAYLLPLKKQVESLGTLVFGPSFKVDIAEDWSIRSRTVDGKTLPFDDLSIGAKEQIAILMRLAAAQLVAHQNGVPLFIDDALGFSDPQKLTKMGAAIAAAGRDCQIIILTCSPGRYANVGNAKVIRLDQ